MIPQALLARVGIATHRRCLEYFAFCHEHLTVHPARRARVARRSWSPQRVGVERNSRRFVQPQQIRPCAQLTEVAPPLQFRARNDQLKADKTADQNDKEGWRSNEPFCSATTHRSSQPTRRNARQEILSLRANCELYIRRLPRSNSQNFVSILENSAGSDQPSTSSQAIHSVSDVQDSAPPE